MVAGFPASRPRRMGERRFFPAGQSGTAENLSGLKNLSTVMAPRRGRVSNFRGLSAIGNQSDPEADSGVCQCLRSWQGFGPGFITALRPGTSRRLVGLHRCRRGTHGVGWRGAWITP